MAKEIEHYCQVKKNDIGGYGTIDISDRIFELENYGIALWKEFGDDVKEPFEAMMKMLDEPECIEDRWLDDEAKGEKWLLEFQELALTEEYREWIRNYIDKNMKKEDYHIRQEQTSIKRSAFFWSFGR